MTARSLFSVLGAIWPSILGSILAALGAFLSMGLLGLLLYYLVSPALNLAFPPLDAWDQTVVWPLVIGVALLWSPSFVPAGILTYRLKAAGWSRRRRAIAYCAILWLGALVSWWILLLLNTDVWQR